MIRTILLFATAAIGLALWWWFFQPKPFAPAPIADSPLPSDSRSAPVQAGLHGRLVDDLGTPIATATVIAAGTGRAETRSDLDGRFVLDPPRDEPVVLAVRHPHFAPRILATDLRLRSDEHHRDLGEILIRSGAGLLVEVHSRSGPPIAGAEVRLTAGLHRVDLPPFAITLGDATARTGDDGIATFYGVNPGIWNLVIRASGHGTRLVQHEQPKRPEASPRAIVRLGPAAVLSGRIRTADGLAASGARVLVTPETVGYPTAETRADDNGFFRLVDLAPGSWRVTVIHPRGRLRRSGIAAGDRLLDLQLPPGRGLHGQVLHARTRRPIAGARIEARLPAAWAIGAIGRRDLTPSTVSDADGKFRFRGLPAGILHLVATSKNLCSARSGPLQPVLPGGDRPAAVVLLLPEGCTVTGHTLSPSGLPLEDAVIQPIPTRENDDPALTGRPLPAVVRSRAGGGFRIVGLRAGRYRVAVRAPGRPTLHSAPFDAKPAGHLDLGPLQLVHGGEIHGTAYQRSGAPAASATVYFRPDPRLPDRPSTTRTTKSDAHGRFRLTTMTPGSYRMFYDYPDRQSPRAAAASRAATSVRVQLQDREEHRQDLRPRVR